MVLGASELYTLINEKQLITGIDDYDFKIEGVTVDVRLGELFLHKGGAELYATCRSTGDVEALHCSREGVYCIAPGYVCLTQTIESINMPHNLVAHIDTRTTVFRSGLMLKATYINPGYSGKLTFLLVNDSCSIVKIQRGFRIAQMVFHEIKGSCNPYHGQWQGGKVHTNGSFVGAR